MSVIENLLNEDNLVPNVNGAAYFILLYEHFEDSVISAVQDVYSTDLVMDGMLFSRIDDNYISKLKKKIQSGEIGSPIPYKRLYGEAIKSRDKYTKEVLDLAKKEKDGKRLKGSLIWLKNDGVFSEQECKQIWNIRKRRNEIVHELFNVLNKGLTETDAKMIVELLEYNQKLNKWHFQELDAPALDDEIPQGVQTDDIVGYDDSILMGIFRILFCNEGQAFKEEIEKVKSL